MSGSSDPAENAGKWTINQEQARRLRRQGRNINEAVTVIPDPPRAANRGGTS